MARIFQACRAVRDRVTVERRFIAAAAALVATLVLGRGVAAATEAPPPKLTVFWAVGCPHCEEARPAIAALASEHPTLVVEWVEVRQHPDGRAQLVETARRLGVEGAGVPMFVVGDRFVVGFRSGVTEPELRQLVEGAGAATTSAAPGAVELPLFGTVDPSRISFPLFTVLIALADGVNPCAFYVLVVLLGLMLNVHSRRRIALYGGVFVVMSGVVYFLFMTAWLGLFVVVGGARWITIALGVVLVGMGLINLKELVWFKRGVSLVIPDRSKPGLFRRMRAIAASTSLPAAFVAIALLAFVVNLVELGCTLGLPAIYTRLLSLHGGLSSAGRYAYLALYNIVYVLPLAAIVALYVVTLTRIAMTERRAKILKALSGILLLGFGVVFLVSR